MDDACARWHDLEFFKGALTPAQELVALKVAFIFQINVQLFSILATKEIHDDRVVDDQFRWCQWLDLAGVSSELCNSFAHGCKVNNHWNTSEVLHHHTCRSELDFFAWLGSWIPVAKGCDGFFGDVGAIFGAQEVLKKHLVREGKAITARDRCNSENLVGIRSNLQISFGTKTVHAGHTFRSK